MNNSYFNYKNNFKHEQEQKLKNKHKKSSSMSVSVSYNHSISNNRRMNYSGVNSSSPMQNGNSHYAYNNKNNNSINTSNKDSVEDYQRLAKKFYSIIISLQDELTKQTVRNFNLLEENMSLKQELTEFQKGKGNVN